ncbi:MAG: glycosyltransferase [Candidatus Thorarchaeota archaeon]
MTPVKILYIDSSVGIGGSTTCLKNLVSNLNRQKYEPIIAFIFQKKSIIVNEYFKDQNVIFLRGINSEVYLAIMSVIEKNKMLKRISLDKIFIFLAKLIFERIFSFMKIFSLLKREKIGIMHLNNGASLSAIFAAKIAHVPCVSTIRSFSSYSSGEGLFYRMADRLIPVSNSVKESIIKNFKVATKKVEVIYDGIEQNSVVTLSADGKEEIREKYNLDSSAIIGTMGRLVPFKKQEIMIMAVDKLIKNGMNIKCLIVGAAENDSNSIRYANNLKDLVKKLNLSHHVRFMGFQDNPFEIIESFDVFVLPSILEPFGMVVLEAMSLGIPVISFDKGGPSEIIRDREDGILVPVGDINALAEAIDLLLRDRGLYEKISKNAFLKVKNEFTIQKNINKYENLYESLIS